MKKYSYDDVVNFIQKKLNENIAISLREIARHFSTSHTQIKRIMKKTGIYEQYLKAKLEIEKNAKKRNSFDFNTEEVLEKVRLSEDLYDIPDRLYNHLQSKKEKIAMLLPYRNVNLSVDIREIENVKKLVEYEKNIKKNRNNNFNVNLKIGFISDIHLGHHNEEALNLSLSYLKNMNVDVLILGGDILDNESISYWKNKGKLTFDEEILLGREFLKQLREFLGNEVEIYWINGNHDQVRLERFILTYAKELIDLEELKIPSLLHFDKYNIKFVDNTEHIRKYGHPFRIGKLNFLHGHEIKSSWQVVNVARTMFLKAHDNIIFGHFHTCQEYYQKDISGNVRGAWAVGCMCDLNPEYSPINNWVNGFAYIEMSDSGEFIVYNKKIVDNMIV